MGFGLVQVGTFSYRLTSRILLPFSGSGCSTSQREYQLHRENKYLKIEYLLKSQAQYRVWLFFYFHDTFFRCGVNLFVDILNGNRNYTLSAFRLVIPLQCRKAKLNMEVSLR